MATPQQPKGDGHSGVRPAPHNPPSDANGDPDRTTAESPRRADATQAAPLGFDDLFLDAHAEPTDDSPTVISRGQPRALSSEEVFAGSLRGRRLAHFELLEPIGVGGMAAVIRAQDTQLDRPVALKILPPEMTNDPESVRRFHQEARAAARLDHENIARVFFCGEDQGLHFIAFEFVLGDNLRTVLERRGRLPVAEALHYLLQIATGLEHAASRGVVHRDIKPSNIIISPNGRAKLVDMGLARSLAPQDDKGLTQSGVTLGTFDYISPEQALEPREADVRSDIYSLGCTFYHVLTGQPPVPEGTAAKKLHHHQHVAPIDPRQLNPDIPDEVAAILARMMAKDAKARYQSVDRLVQHLIVVAQKLEVNAEVPQGLLFVDTPLPDPPRARPILLAAVAAAVLVGLVLVLGQFGGNSAPNERPFPGPAGPPSKDAKAVQPDPTPQAGNHEQLPVKDGPAKPAVTKVARFSNPQPKVADLQKFLQDNQGAELEITLTGDLELGGIGEGDAKPILSLLFKAPRVVIQAASDSTVRPTIRLTYNLLPPPTVMPALVFESDDVTLKGVRIVVDATASEAKMAGVLFKRGQRCRVENCEFVQVAPLPDPEHARLTSVLIDSRGGPRVHLDLNDCYFVGVKDLQTMEGVEKGGHEAVALMGPAQVGIVNCAFAPHAVLFHLGEGVPVADTALRVSNCSALVAGDWTAFCLDSRAGALLEVENCLFARANGAAEADAPPEDRRVVLLQQTGDIAGTVKYAGKQNRYYGLTAFWVRDGEDPEIPTLEEFQTEASKYYKKGGDAGSLVLAQTPWQESEPLAQLKQRKPQLAFQVDLKLRELRHSADTNRLLGVERCTWGDSYAKVPPLREERPPEPVAVGKELIVDPSKETGSGVYRTLNQALEDIKQRGVIRIRHTGPLAIDPVRLEKAGLDVTIQPDQGHRPMLTLGQTTERDAFLFRVHDGKLALRDLEFLLQPRNAEFRTQSVIEVVGEGTCSFSDCVVTLDRAGKEVPLAVARLAEAGLVMKMDPSAPPAAQVPALNFEDCLVRGRGELLHVRGGRPFVLDARNSLFALAGSWLTVSSSREDVAAGQVGVVRLDQVTTYSIEHLVRMRAGKDTKGMVPLQVKATNNLFVSQAGLSLVHLDGPETGDEKLKGLFQWEGRHNAYSNFNHLLDQQPPGEEMPLRGAYDPTRWKDYTGESDGLFTPRIKFTDPPAADADLARVSKDHFKVKAATDHQGYGANLDKLPTPSAPAVPGPEE